MKTFTNPHDLDLVTSRWARRNCKISVVFSILIICLIHSATATAKDGLLFPLRTCYVGDTRVSCSHENAAITALLDHDGGDTFIELFSGDKASGAASGTVLTNPNGEHCALPARPHILELLLSNYVGSARAQVGKDRYLCYDGHPGTDYRIYNESGNQYKHEVRPAAPGRVIAIANPANSNDLKLVEINHTNGVLAPYSTRYLHLDSVDAGIFVGKEVGMEDVIGISGKSGTDGPHLHFEVTKCPADAPNYGCGRHTQEVDPYGTLSADAVSSSEQSLGSFIFGSLWKNWPLVEIEAPGFDEPNLDVVDRPLTRSINPKTDVDETAFEVSVCSEVTVGLEGLEGVPFTLLRVSDAQETELTSICTISGDFQTKVGPGSYKLRIGEQGNPAERAHNYTQTISIEASTCPLFKEDILAKTNILAKTSCEQPLEAASLVAPNSSSAPGIGLDVDFPTLYWNPVTGAATYDISVYETGTTQKRVYYKTGITASQYFDPHHKLARGEGYYWIVHARDAQGARGKVSTKGYFSLQANVPQSPVIGTPQITAPGSGNAPVLSAVEPRPTLQWIPPQNVARLGLYMRDLTTRKFVLFDENIPPSATSYRVPANTLVDGHDYKWNMSAFNSNGTEGPISNSLYFKYEHFATNDDIEFEIIGTRIDDNSVNDSIGDDDGFAESGERIELDIFIKNIGSSVADDVLLTLRTTESCLSIERDTLGGLRLNNTRPYAIGDFLVDIGNCGNDELLNLKVDIKSGSYEETHNISFRVFDADTSQAEIVISALEIDDEDEDYGNDDGDINAGETLDLKFEITNIGQEKTGSLTGMLRGDHPCLAVNYPISGPVSGPDVGSTREFRYEISVTPDCPLPAVIDVIQHVEEERGSWSERYSLTIKPQDHRPDIAIMSIVYQGDTHVLYRDHPDFDVTLANYGEMEARDIEVGVFYSEDSDIDLNDQLLHTEEHGKLGPGNTAVFDLDASLEVNLGQGYIGVCALPFYGESNFLDNCSEAIRIIVGPETVPDLAIELFDLQDSYPSSDFDGPPKIGIRAKNVGDMFATSTRVDQYLARDEPTIDQTSYQGTTTWNVPELDPSSTWNGEWSIMHPPQLGLYWVTYCLEPAHNEVNLTNNCTSASFTVRTPEVDRRPRSASAFISEAGSTLSNEATKEGVQVSLEVTIENLGDNSETGTLELSWSPTQNFGVQSEIVLSEIVENLYKNESRDFVVLFTIPDREKVFWLRACSKDTPFEVNQSNDCMVKKINLDDDLCFPLKAKNGVVIQICL